MHEDAKYFDLKTQFNVEDNYLGMVVRHFADEMGRGVPNGRLFAEGLSLTMLGWLAKYHSTIGSSSLSVRRLSEGHQQLIRSYVDERIGDDVSVTDLASLVGLSPSHFARLFKTTFSLSPHRFLLNRRIELAAERLRANGDQSIAEIALAFGFGSQAHFSDTFRRIRGETPARWRIYNGKRRRAS